jgi:hypothetical protein
MGRPRGRSLKGPGTLFLRDGIWWITYHIDGRSISESSGSTQRRKAVKLLNERHAGVSLPPVFLLEFSVHSDKSTDLQLKIKAESVQQNRKYLQRLKTEIDRLLRPDRTLKEFDPLGREAKQWESFLLAIHGVFSGSAFTISDLDEKIQGQASAAQQQLCATMPDRIAAIAARDDLYQSYMGKLFSQHCERRFGKSGIHLRRDQTSSRSLLVWRVGFDSPWGEIQPLLDSALKSPTSLRIIPEAIASQIFYGL